jgi:hypothetical protein
MVCYLHEMGEYHYGISRSAFCTWIKNILIDRLRYSDSKCVVRYFRVSRYDWPLLNESPKACADLIRSLNNTLNYNIFDLYNHMAKMYHIPGELKTNVLHIKYYEHYERVMLGDQALYSEAEIFNHSLLVFDF